MQQRQQQQELLESTRSETVPILSDEGGAFGHSDSASGAGRLRRRLANCLCIRRLLPVANLVAEGRYSLRDVAADIVAGLTMCVFHIPQGLAYGQLAGVQPVNGLYTSLIPAMLYCWFARSHHLSLGTFSLMSLLLAELVEDEYPEYLAHINATRGEPPPAVDDEMTLEDYARMQVATAGSLGASVVALLLGIAHLGSMMQLVSRPMLRGFTTTAAFYIFTSQLPTMLGVKEPKPASGSFKLISTYSGIIEVLPSTNWATVLTTVISSAALLAGRQFVNPIAKRKLKAPLPLELLLILISLLVSHAAQLEQSFGITVVGHIPRGFPSPVLPDLELLDNVAPRAVVLGLIGAAMSLSIVKTYAMQFEYSVNYNAELLAIGAASTFGCFFQCFYACGALARCAVVVGAGMRSQVATLVSCLGLLVVVLAAGPIFEAVPACVLASIIAVSLLGLFSQVSDIVQLARSRQLLDLSEWLVTAVAVLLLDVSFGLGIGFGYSLLRRGCELLHDLWQRRRRRQQAAAGTEQQQQQQQYQQQQDASDERKPLTSQYPLRIPVPPSKS